MGYGVNKVIYLISGMSYMHNFISQKMQVVFELNSSHLNYVSTLWIA